MAASQAHTQPLALLDPTAHSPGQSQTTVLRKQRELGHTDPAMALSDLSDQAYLVVDQAAYDQWRERLDAPPQPNERLRRALRTPAPWES
ncbi:MAG: DUF1778 domain-containing protein [Magnetococcales bacterium]|nr:DUF1778 domain-containing protein [Magnetococcales bacterium]